MPLSAVDFVKTLEIEEFGYPCGVMQRGHARGFGDRPLMASRAGGFKPAVASSAGGFAPPKRSSAGKKEPQKLFNLDEIKAAVVAGSLVSYTNNLTAQDKADVLNSTMLAQLVANKKHDRSKDPENWYKSYMHVMENIGWVIQEFQFKEYQSQQKSLEISNVVMELLRVLIDPSLIELVLATVNSLKNAKDGLKLFEEKSSSEKGANFQVLPCSVDNNGQVTAALLGFHIKPSTGEFSGNYFFVTLSTKSIELSYTAETITLNKDVYSPAVREEVINKLGKHAKNSVAELEI